MKQSSTKLRALPLALTALTAAAWTATPALASGARTQTFKGAQEFVDHGPVQVSIVVKSKKIVSVKVANSPQESRSVFIQGQALPILVQETLRAQSARVNEVSGATDTSTGYIMSLQSAIKKAQKVKALK